MGSNQSIPVDPGGGGREENATDRAAVEAEPHPSSPSSFRLSLAGRQIIGDDGARLFFPCPASTALTVHHHEDFADIEIPIQYIVKNASLFDLHGAQTLLTRFVDAIKDAVLRLKPKEIRLANPQDFQMNRYETQYAQEIASMCHDSVLTFIRKYNHDVKTQDPPNAEVVNSTEAPAEKQPAPAGEPLSNVTNTPADRGRDKLPESTNVPADVPTEQPSRKRKDCSPTKVAHCDNCGGNHSRTLCRTGCRSCGKLHPNRNLRCPDESKQCWCTTYPQHLCHQVRYPASRTPQFLTNEH